MDGSHYIGTDGIGRRSTGNTEVCHLYFTVHGNNNILGFHITMYDSVAMSSFQSHGNLDCNTGSLFYRELSFLGDVFFKSDPFDQFHYNVIDAVVISYIKYIYNIGVCQNCCSLCLTSELADKCCILPKFRLKHFHCNKTVQFMILRLVYICHSAGSYFA